MAKTVYVFRPVGLDAWERRPHQPKPGTRVVKTQPPGTPRNGTMGHTYVEDAETGKFYGLVLLNSLVEPDPIAEAHARATWNQLTTGKSYLSREP